MINTLIFKHVSKYFWYWRLCIAILKITFSVRSTVHRSVTWQIKSTWSDTDHNFYATWKVVRLIPALRIITLFTGYNYIALSNTSLRLHMQWDHCWELRPTLTSRLSGVINRIHAWTSVSPRTCLYILCWDFNMLWHFLQN